MAAAVLQPAVSPEPVDDGVDGLDEVYAGESLPGPHTIERFEVDVREDPLTVFELLRQLDKGRIQLSPDFQRGDVWDDGRRSRFVESVLLNIPLPPLYLNQLRDGKLVVVDGKQRISSLSRFRRGGFALEGLRTLWWLNDTRGPHEGNQSVERHRGGRVRGQHASRIPTMRERAWG